MSTIPEVPIPAPQPKTSGLAIASLICGIAGFCTLGVGALVGLILGIIAILDIKKSLGQIRGMGVAVAGVIISGFILLMIPVIVMILIPSFLIALKPGFAAAASSNISQVGEMALEYAQEHKGQLPTADQWVDQCAKYWPANKLADPADPYGGRAIAMNAKVAGVSVKSIRDPGRTVLFFECANRAPPAGGPENLPTQPRHGPGFNICFCDGTVAAMPPPTIKNLNWDP
jgi:prepilin-type processing-associated H-X9-DG protein